MYFLMACYYQASGEATGMLRETADTPLQPTFLVVVASLHIDDNVSRTAREYVHQA